MNKLIQRRGPDDDGYYFEPGIGLAMKRLSIIDLSTGKQPIFNEDETVCVLFNGEIYNYQDLYAQLFAKGHKFKTKSDTEVIVHLYEEYAIDFVKYLQGMFAIALWDISKKELFLVRDRLGIKPLFYSNLNGNIIFGSEIKCILASGIIPTDINYQSIDLFFNYTYIPAPYTIYKYIHKLKPGHMLHIKNNKVKDIEFWNLHFSPVENDQETWEEKIESELLKAIDLHLLSDVPLGAFLSGGIDSSLVVAMMGEFYNQPIESFIMAYEGNAAAVLDERPYARMLTEKYHVNLNEFLVNPYFSEIGSELVKSFDEPFADDSIIPSYYISKFTRQKVKVALSGLGGDELFGGYERYQGFLLSLYYGKMPGFIHKNLVNPVIQYLPELKTGKNKINHLKRFSKNAMSSPALRYYGYVSSIDEPSRRMLYGEEIKKYIDFEETRLSLIDHFNACESDDLMNKMFYTDLKTYLPEDILALSDRVSMWHSLEVRVPLIDHKLVELAATVPSRFKVRLNDKKYILKKIAAKWIPKPLITHRKQGFEAPMASWLKNDLKEYVYSVLNDKSFKQSHFINTEFVKYKFEEHLQGKSLNNKLIFSTIMFYLWYKENLS